MSQEFRIDTVLVSNRVRLNNNAAQGVIGLPQSAWYGEPASAGVRIDDPLGELDLRGWHTFTHDETSCTGNERTFSGWIIGRTVDRGSLPPVEASRVWDCTIVDLNAAFGFEVFRASSAKRPEETDIERVAWAQASAPMAGTPLNDNGRFNTTDNPVNFGPADYVTQYPLNLFESVAGTSGKNFYAYFDQTAEEPSMHYDLVTANPLSTLRISNDMADKDSVTFYPFKDGQLSRDPTMQVTGILFGYLGGNYVYGRNAALIAALSPTEFSPVNFLRDAVYTTDRVGKESTANSLLAAQLAARAVEIDKITCAIRVPAAQVNLLMAGDAVDVKFSHLPGYEDFVSVPVIRRNVVPSPGRRDMYDIHLELSNEIQAVGPGGGDPGESPYEPAVCDDTFADTVDSGGFQLDPSGDIVLDWTPTAGNTLVGYIAHRDWGDTTTPDGWFPLTDYLTNLDDVGWARAWYYHVQPGDTDTFTTAVTGSGERGIVVVELLGTLIPSTVGTSTTGDQGCSPPWLGNTVGTVTVGNNRSVMIGGMVYLTDVSDPRTSTPWAPTTELVDMTNGVTPQQWMGRREETTSGTYSIATDSTGSGCQRGFLGFVVAFECDAGSTPPGALQIVRGEVITMVGDTGTTNFPFAPGSLEVFVDNTDQTAAIIDQDPAAGTFQLGFTPTPTELVVVNYLAGVGGPGT
jgi:hypothetical protein